MYKFRGIGTSQQSSETNRSEMKPTDFIQSKQRLSDRKRKFKSSCKISEILLDASAAGGSNEDKQIQLDLMRFKVLQIILDVSKKLKS